MQLQLILTFSDHIDVKPQVRLSVGPSGQIIVRETGACEEAKAALERLGKRPAPTP